MTNTDDSRPKGSLSSSGGLEAFLPQKSLPSIKTLDSVLRVDLAGEQGAVGLYEGQIAATKSPEKKETLQDMLAHEQEHENLFKDLVAETSARPSFFTPVWKRLGYAVGWLSGKLGYDWALAQTEGVETVIESHYQKQLDFLTKQKPFFLKKDQLVYIQSTIQKCQEDETAHKDHGFEARQKTLFLDTWKMLNQLGTSIAVKIAKRF